MGQSEFIKAMSEKKEVKRKRDHGWGKAIMIIGVGQMVISAILLLLFNLPTIDLNAFLAGNLMFGMFTTVGGFIVMDVNRTPLFGNNLYRGE